MIQNPPTKIKIQHELTEKYGERCHRCFQLFRQLLRGLAQFFDKAMNSVIFWLTRNIKTHDTKHLNTKLIWNWFETL